MPPNDTSDVHDRFRSPRSVHGRPAFIDGIRRAQPLNRSFPDIGTTLTPRRPPTQAPPVRARQPIAAAALSDAAATSAVSIPVPAAQPVPARRSRNVRKRHKIFTKKRIALVLVILLLAVGGWLGVKFFYNVQKVFHGSLFSVLTTTKLKGEDSGRVNILLAGNSADDPGHDGANLTDSIMIISISVKDGSAFLLSVPRDLWVDIPGYGHAKINEAYVDGENGNFTSPDYPSGGMGLLEEVVQQNFGITANYYALINYDALRDGVNAVGGIDVNIQSSDPRGLYDPSIDWSTHGPLVKLKNGIQHLNGEQALDLARARGDAYGSYGFPRSDFDRTEHQRQMIFALKDKALSAGVLANPITVSNLFDSVGKNVRTDFTLGEVRRLYDIGKGINNNNIVSASLNDADGVNLLRNYTSPTGQSTLIPAAGIDDFSKIKAYVQRLLSNNPVVREAAKVVILNGTDVSGLAAQKEKALETKDIDVVAVGDASAPSTTTSIIDASNGKMPATLALLKSVYGAAAVTTQNPYANVYDADFIIVLGGDQAQTVATPSQ